MKSSINYYYVVELLGFSSFSRVFVSDFLGRVVATSSAFLATRFHRRSDALRYAFCLEHERGFHNCKVRRLASVTPIDFV